MSGFSEFDKAVIKATKHNTKPPKEKHVRRKENSYDLFLPLASKEEHQIIAIIIERRSRKSNN
jgi:hypothetical protein